MMEPIYYLLIAYAITYVVFYRGLFHSARLRPSTKLESATLLLPMKDESENVDRCLAALLAQDYPLDQLELIILNDFSEDDTVAKVRPWLVKFPNARLIEVKADERLIGKANGLHQGVEAATHDVIVICDADCAPNPAWLRTLVAEFNEDVGVSSGFTLLENPDRSMFVALQNMDWMLLLGAGASAVGSGHPISCIGSNLAFRKRYYQAIGGYPALPFNITEDLLLYQTIAKRKLTRFRFPIRPETINWTRPMTSVNGFWRQRKRWLFGFKGLSLYGFWLMGVFSVGHYWSIVHVITQGDPLPLMLMIVSDILIMVFLTVCLSQLHLLLYLPVYVLFYIVNLIIIPFALVFGRKVEWKKRTYNRHGHIQ